MSHFKVGGVALELLLSSQTQTNKNLKIVTKRQNPSQCEGVHEFDSPFSSDLIVVEVCFSFGAPLHA